MNGNVPVVRERINKVVIIPYEDKDFQTPMSSGPFALPVNPETYSRTYKVEYDDRVGHGQRGTDPKFKASPPEELKLDFIFDSTGTIEGYHYNLGNTDSDFENGKAVEKQVCKFLDTVYRPDGETHRPNFLKICWGKLNFTCVTTNVDINYTLFDDKGHPIRAKASATFVEYLSPEKREREGNLCSPDLTHRHMIKEGDRLDLIVYGIYNDPQFLLQVARVNGLGSIRNIQAGNVLVLPPIDKTEV